MGSFVWDVIHGRDPRDAPVEEWGGITYALGALEAALPADWEFVPILKVGSDLAQSAREFVADLDRVLVTSETGELDALLAVTDDVPLGVAYLPKGRWPKREPGGANVNVLTPSRASDMGRSATFHGTEVTLRAASA